MGYLERLDRTRCAQVSVASAAPAELRRIPCRKRWPGGHDRADLSEAVRVHAAREPVLLGLREIALVT